VYLYQFEHAPDVTQADRCLGVFHGAELPFVFFDKPLLDVREREFGQQMVTWSEETEAEIPWDVFLIH
jgi:carboxylesterase type B